MLESASVAPRQIGVDLGRKGLRDEDIIVLLRRLRRITFFTRDQGFYNSKLRHQNYCLVVLAVGQYEVAAFVRRFLRHRHFSTQAKRNGKVARASNSGVSFWETGFAVEQRVMWRSA